MAGVGAAVTAKIVSKGLLKAAAEALSKVLLAKAAGTAGGAAVGGAIGSVVPGAGTALGGVVGGIIGGVLVNGVLLILEEAVSREDLKREIIAAIRDARTELKKRLEGYQSTVATDGKQWIASHNQTLCPLLPDSDWFSEC